MVKHTTEAEKLLGDEDGQQGATVVDQEDEEEGEAEKMITESKDDHENINLEEVNCISEVKQDKKSKRLPLTTMLFLMVRLLPYMLPLFFVYFGEYLINQAIAPILIFPGSWFAGKEYQFYQVRNI